MVKGSPWMLYFCLISAIHSLDETRRKITLLLQLKAQQSKNSLAYGTARSKFRAHNENKDKTTGTHLAYRRSDCIQHELVFLVCVVILSDTTKRRQPAFIRRGRAECELLMMMHLRTQEQRSPFQQGICYNSQLVSLSLVRLDLYRTFFSFQFVLLHQLISIHQQPTNRGKRH